MDHFGNKAFMLTVLSYGILVSYTLPQGFVPIISLQALPILLLGFLVYLLAIYVFLTALFLPFIAYKSNFYQDLIKDTLYGEPFEPLEEKYKEKNIGIGLRELYKDLLKENGGKFGFLFFIFCIAIPFIQINVPTYISILAWYYLANVVNPKTLVFASVFFYAAYYALNKFFWIGPIEEKKLPAAILIFMFVIFPILPTESSKNMNFHLQPNSIVRFVLKKTNIGGGELAELHDSDSSKFGELVFFDSSTAWYLSCDRENVRGVTQEEVGKITIYDNLDCHSLRDGVLP